MEEGRKHRVNDLPETVANNSNNNSSRNNHHNNDIKNHHCTCHSCPYLLGAVGLEVLRPRLPPRTLLLLLLLVVLLVVAALKKVTLEEERNEEVGESPKSSGMQH